jgi:hypothetical protein
VSVALVDDRVLGLALRGRTPRALRRYDLATTGSWYVRLCQVVLGAADRRGVLPGPLADLPIELRDRALAALLELPRDIELLSLGDLAPDIGRLRTRHALNMLGVEALAAAIRLDAEVVLSASAPGLTAALDAEGCRHRRYGTGG